MAATLETSVRNGLRIMQIGNRVMVASRSEPGRWWDVTEGTCGCKGFEHRGRCAHLTATANLFKPAETDTEQADAEIDADAPIMLELTGRSYLALLRPAALPAPVGTIVRVPYTAEQARIADELGMADDLPLGAA